MPRPDLYHFVRVSIAGGFLLLAAGCSSLNHYLVDAQGAAGIHLESAAVYDEQRESHTYEFDASGGRVDPDSSRIRGLNTRGERVEFPFQRVRQVTFKRTGEDTGGAVTARFGPLRDDFKWTPGGRILYVVQSDSTVIDLRRVPSRLDVASHVVLWSPAPDQEAKIPFDSIAYLQMKQGSGGRTALLVTGLTFVAGIIAVGIALSSWGGV